MVESTQQAMWRCGRCGRILAIWVRHALFPDGCWLFVADALRLAQPYVNVARVQCRCGQVNVWTLEAHTLREKLDRDEIGP